MLKLLSFFRAFIHSLNRSLLEQNIYSLRCWKKRETWQTILEEHSFFRKPIFNFSASPLVIKNRNQINCITFYGNELAKWNELR